MNLARRRGVAIRFVTNTATRHHDDLLQDLQQLGLAAEPSELATAPLAARSWLEREHRHPMALVHPAIAPLFAGSSGEQPDCVLLGDCRDLLSYANLNTAAFDGKGRIWFTGQNGIYGRLDPASGEMKLWDAPTLSAIRLSPCASDLSKRAPL